MQFEKDMRSVLEDYPTLNAFGIGLYDADRKKTKDEQVAILAKNREDFFKKERVDVILTAMGWLIDHITPTETINQRRTSYGMKHVIQDVTGYITNGEFILAAIMAGFKLKIMAGPNVKFGMSERSWRHAEELRRQDLLKSNYEYLKQF